LGPALALLAAFLVAAAWAFRAPWLGRVALALAAFGVALVAWRLASPPDEPVLREVRSVGALVLALAGAVTVAVAAALAARPSGLRARAVTVDADQREALASAWHALWTSRVVVWVAGVLAVLKLGTEPTVSPPAFSRPFGSLGDLLTAPATAWDAGSYATIAQGGYSQAESLQAFFPLYPTLVRAGSRSPETTIVVGIVVSLVAFAVALYLLHRLVALERGRDVAGLAVLLVAFSPLALFFSAVYTESLFLALSVGAFYAARRGCWWLAGIAGGLAATTRVAGVLVLVPLAILYLYGPRGDRPAPASPAARSLRPRFPLEPSAAWLLLVPAGTLAFAAYLGAHGDALAPLHMNERYWDRDFVPGLGALRGIEDAWLSLREIAGSHALTTPSVETAGQLADPMKLAGANLTDFAFLVFAVVACVGAFRRLPAAYGAYVLATIAVAVSSVPPYAPLTSAPRYLLVAFPCQVWLAIWASSSTGRRQASLLVSAGLLALFAAQFASWRWVA
ncbi:MAG TPA: mannosyltransferase family protein, partial [Solirubrobacteraceae bacterium]|nr:mannosyltransferase family protein [Solirubrobacteraceae bacterium]